MKIKGIHVRVGEKPEIIEFENSNQNFKLLVEGNAQLVILDNNTVMFCNEINKLLGLEGNRALDNGKVIAGNFIIVGDNGGEETISLTDEQIEKYMKRFDKIEYYVKIPLVDDMEECL
jgi:hypothetical protein